MPAQGGNKTADPQPWGYEDPWQAPKKPCAKRNQGRNAGQRRTDKQATAATAQEAADARRDPQSL